VTGKHISRDLTIKENIVRELVDNGGGLQIRLELTHQGVCSHDQILNAARSHFSSQAVIRDNISIVYTDAFIAELSCSL
jgi:hypothetical protein